MTKFNAETALAQLTAQIEDAVQHWTKGREKIQHALVGICSYTHMSGSKDHLARLTNSLIDGLGDGINANAIRQWAVEHLGMHLNSNTNKMVPGKKAPEDFDTKVASGVKWWTLAPQKPYVFDLNSAVMSLLKQAEGAAEKAAKKGGDSKADVDPETLQMLKELSAVAQTRKELSEAKSKAEKADA